LADDRADLTRNTRRLLQQLQNNAPNARPAHGTPET
jgi:hypothetical protein